MNHPIKSTKDQLADKETKAQINSRNSSRDKKLLNRGFEIRHPDDTAHIPSHNLVRMKGSFVVSWLKWMERRKDN